VVNRWFLAMALLSCCAPASPEARDGGLILEHFRLVDPRTRTVREGDVIVRGGIVRATASPDVKYEHVNGRGRWLLPALWDLTAWLGGNRPAQGQFPQVMTVLPCLRLELYYAVGHVGGSPMSGPWFFGENSRSHALEVSAAELLAPDRVLAGSRSETFRFLGLTVPSQAAPLLDEIRAKGTPFVWLSYGDDEESVAPSLSRDVLEETLVRARHADLPTYVFVDDWKRAEEAVRFGASAIHGLPCGELSSDLIAMMHEKGTFYAPALARDLELGRILGNVAALHDPFLREGVPPSVLESFGDPARVWEGFRPFWVKGTKYGARSLEDLKRMEQGGVRLLSASDSGWAAGTFPGYSVHATQDWMEKAGLDAWTRLSAATTWPAEFVGRTVGFREGDAADFVALTADPLLHADSLRQIAVLVRDGRLVERDTLRPDLQRLAFPPP
jgi:hypothetical protein